MWEIYEKTPVSDENLQYALFSSQPTIFEEVMKDAQWVHANEEVNENDKVDAIHGKHQDVNALQDVKYAHIFVHKKFQCAR